MSKQELVIILLSVYCLINVTSAKPYYYFFQGAPEPEQQTQAQVAGNIENGAQAVGQQAQQQGLKTEQLHDKITGHLGQLYNHGSTAVKNVVDNVAPDLKNIGADLTEVYHVTGDNVGKKIEPLANNVKPYINQAQKAMAPYVSQAKEEVPKLINQAGPALTKVGEQVRDGLTGVWEKIKTVGNQDQTIGGQFHQVGNQVQQMGEKAQTKVHDAVGQPAAASISSPGTQAAASQPVAEAAQNVASQTQQAANQIQS